MINVVKGDKFSDFSLGTGYMYKTLVANDYIVSSDDYCAYGVYADNECIAVMIVYKNIKGNPAGIHVWGIDSTITTYITSKEYGTSSRYYPVIQFNPSDSYDENTTYTLYKVTLE